MLCSHKDLILLHLAVEQFLHKSQWNVSTAESGSLYTYVYIFFPMDLLSVVIIRGKLFRISQWFPLGFCSTNRCFRKHFCSLLCQKHRIINTFSNIYLVAWVLLISLRLMYMKKFILWDDSWINNRLSAFHKSSTLSCEALRCWKMLEGTSALPSLRWSVENWYNFPCEIVVIM